jgi:hypothetical protein
VTYPRIDGSPSRRASVTTNTEAANRTMMSGSVSVIHHGN